MILGIVTARLGSTRLPAKALLPIGRHTMRTMVGYVCFQMEQSCVDKVVLCTPDLFLAECHSCDSVVWTGDRDLTSELRAAANAYNADHIVRVTADCPFVTSDIINRVVDEHLKGGSDYTYNHHDCLPSVTKEGIDVEVITRKALQIVKSKEHLYIGEGIKIHRVDMEEEREVFSVNTLEDYMRAFKEL